MISSPLTPLTDHTGKLQAVCATYTHTALPTAAEPNKSLKTRNHPVSVNPLLAWWSPTLCHKPDQEAAPSSTTHLQNSSFSPDEGSDRIWMGE